MVFALLCWGFFVGEGRAGGRRGLRCRFWRVDRVIKSLIRGEGKKRGEEG